MRVTPRRGEQGFLPQRRGYSELVGGANLRRVQRLRLRSASFKLRGGDHVQKKVPQSGQHEGRQGNRQDERESFELEKKINNNRQRRAYDKQSHSFGFDYLKLVSAT